MFFLELESLFVQDPRERALAERISRAFRPRARAREGQVSEDLAHRRPGAVVARSTAAQRAVARRVARAFAPEPRARRLPRGPQLQALAQRRLGCVRGA